MKNLNRGGFTLLEVVIGSLVGLITIGVIGHTLSRMFTDTRRMNEDYTTESELYLMIEHMMKWGRNADQCSKMVIAAVSTPVAAPASLALQCAVKIYSDQPLVYSRFRKVNDRNNQILFETQNGAGLWDVVKVYGGAGKFNISNFALCDSIDFAAGSTKCSIPTAVAPSPNFGGMLAGTTFASRYFAFQIKATHPDGKRTYDLRSAFFVRNLTPVTDISYMGQIP